MYQSNRDLFTRKVKEYISRYCWKQTSWMGEHSTEWVQIEYARYRNFFVSLYNLVSEMTHYAL